MRVLEATGAHVPVGQALAHRGVADRGPLAGVQVCGRARRSRRNPRRRCRRWPGARSSAWSARPSSRRRPRRARWLSGMRRSVKKTSLKFEVPAICLMRPHLDARAPSCRDDEHGQAGVLRRVRVGARQQEPAVGVVRAGGPDLLAVDDPVVAILHRARAQPGDVRARRQARRRAGTRSPRRAGAGDIARDLPRACRRRSRSARTCRGRSRRTRGGRRSSPPPACR